MMFYYIPIGGTESSKELPVPREKIGNEFCVVNDLLEFPGIIYELKSGIVTICSLTIFFIIDTKSVS